MKSYSYWIDKLALTPHPEGGYYKEVYRSDQTMTHHEHTRNLSTSIYFLLNGHHISHFHQLTSDELWYFHEGTATVIHMIDINGKYSVCRLGKNLGHDLQVVIPAGTIFAAEVEDKNSYTLMGCVVSPGFDFEDFKLFSKEELLIKYPQHVSLIDKFTLSD